MSRVYNIARCADLGRSHNRVNGKMWHGRMAAPACDVDPEAVRSCHDGAVLRKTCNLDLKAEPLFVSLLGVARMRSCMA